MRKACILIISVFSALTLRSQNIFDGDFILFGLGGQLENFRSDLISPLNYGGISGAAALGWHTQKGPWQNNFDGHIAAGYQNPLSLAEVSNRTSSLSGAINYSLRYRILDQEKHDLFLGISSMNLLNYREHNLFRNSSVSFANFISYGPTLSWQFQPEWKIGSWRIPFAWQTEVNTAIASYLIFPGYNRQFFNGDPALREHSFIGEFQHVEFRNNLVYPLKNGNQLRLSYHWHYAQLEALNYYASGQHYLMFHLLFKL